MDWGSYLARGAYRPIYHMCEQSSYFEQVNANDGEGLYFPPTYVQDGFIHATHDPKLLIDVANHFYKSSLGDWICLEISVPWLTSQVIFEAPAPVGNVASYVKEDQNVVKFPHIYGGIRKRAVKKIFPMTRASDGTFTGIDNLPDSFNELAISR
jgi:uncharacterized protein